MLDEFKSITVGDAIVYHGSNLDVLPLMPDNSVDAIVTDPPYELGFMGKSWDSSGIAYRTDLWRECLRVLKPGGHLLSFGGTRTWHRIAVAIEDAGFDVRDSIAWLYGSGFPKSHNLKGDWQGWGTALKPAFEPIIVARKPLVGTVAENVLAWGVGGLNIDASRIQADDAVAGRSRHGGGVVGNGTSFELPDSTSVMPAGRWPANIILDEYTAGLLDEQSGMTKSPQNYIAKGGKTNKIYSSGIGVEIGEWHKEYGDSGGASRFFYVSKANKRDRNEGDVPNTHPTVKPTDLMRYLIKLVTPANGIVLDPFTGSGSTGKAALLDGYQFIGIELTEEYLPIIEGRLKWALNKVSEDKEKQELQKKEALF
jgi:site-specific DNA-methyltransferase (adenine-specific)